MNSDPDIIEAAARALRDKVGSATFAGRSNLLPLSLDDLAQAVLAAVTPLIRAAVLEEAAKVAEDEDGEYWYAGEHRNMAMLQQCCREIAAAIRILKEQPLPSQEGGEP